MKNRIECGNTLVYHKNMPNAMCNKMYTIDRSNLKRHLKNVHKLFNVEHNLRRKNDEIGNISQNMMNLLHCCKLQSILF